jgi:hypothetical protein
LIHAFDRPSGKAISIRFAMMPSGLMREACRIRARRRDPCVRSAGCRHRNAKRRSSSRFDFARIQAFAPLVLAIEFEEVKRIYRNTDAHAVRSLAA